MIATTRDQKSVDIFLEEYFIACPRGSKSVTVIPFRGIGFEDSIYPASGIIDTAIMDERSGLLLPATLPQESNSIPEETAKRHAVKKQDEISGCNGRLSPAVCLIGEQRGQLPELGLSTSWTTFLRPPALVDCSPDKTEEAQSTFQAISSCVYTLENIGSSQDGSMVCNCTMKSGRTSRSDSLLLVPKFILIFNSRRPPEHQYRMRGRRLHQPCDQDGVCR